MADTPFLAQSAPAATTLTDLYTVPASTSAMVSSIFVCNRSAVPTTFRIAIAKGGAADAVAQYLYYDIGVGGSNVPDTFAATVGLGLVAGDKIRCYAAAATLSFNVTGIEIT